MAFFDMMANSRLLTRILMILGLWVASSDSTNYFKRYYRYYQVALHIFTTFLFTLLMLLEFIYSESFEYATQVLKFLLTEIALVLKICNIWYYVRHSADIFREWETSAVFVLETVAERTMWQRAQSGFKKVMFFYVGSSFNAGLCALIAIQFMNTRELPFPYWIPRGWREDYYWLMYSFELLVMPFTVLCNTNLDTFQCYLLFHLSLSIRVIGMRLERLDKAGDDVAITRQLVKVIKMHKNVKNIAKSCEQVLSLPLLVQILLSSFIICFIIYRLQSVRFSDNPAEFSAMFQYVVVMALQIFLPCYFANELTVQSQKLCHHLYSSDWTGMSAYNRRLILLYMAYLKKPLVLHAGNFFEIGLPIFSKTMNNAYSLLALLLNVNDDKK